MDVMPDSMTVGSESMLYLALVNTGKVVLYNVTVNLLKLIPLNRRTIM